MASYGDYVGASRQCRLNKHVYFPDPPLARVYRRYSACRSIHRLHRRPAHTFPETRRQFRLLRLQYAYWVHGILIRVCLLVLAKGFESNKSEEDHVSSLGSRPVYTKIGFEE